MSFTLFPREGDPYLLSFGKGLGVGATTLAGLYGLNEIRKHLMERIYGSGEDPPRPVYFSKPDDVLEKTSSEDIISAYGRKMLYGAGVPLGMYGMYNIISDLKDRADKEKLRNALRDLEVAVREGKDKRTEFHKMSSDEEINGFLDGFLEKCGYISSPRDEVCPPYLTKQSGTLSDLWTDIKEVGSLGGNLLRAAAVDFPVNYAPYLYGGLGSVAALTGYHGTEYLMDPRSRNPKELLSPPRLYYEFQDDYRPRADKKRQIPKRFAV